MGYRTILTLSGVSKQEDLKNYAFAPDMIVENVGQIDLDELLGETKTTRSVASKRNGSLIAH